MHCRSREGAWIEISKPLSRYCSVVGRSREGAWIEISLEEMNVGQLQKSLPRGSVD